MPKASPIQTAFNAGEFSPLLYGRIDFDKYKNGLALCRNWVPTVQGPITKRPGTKFIAPVKDSSKYTRLIPFEFNVEQAYVLEFSDQAIRFYTDDAALVETAVTITGATAADPVVITAASHGYSNGDEIYISGVVGMTELNGRRFTVANKTTNTFELSGTDGTGYTAYVSGGSASRVYTLASPYLEADLQTIQFAQSADVLYLVHENYAPRKLARVGATSWTLTAIEFLDGPYLAVNNDTSLTIAPSATTGTGITLTAVGLTFPSTDVGRMVRIKHSSTWGYAVITAATGAATATADVINDFGATSASSFFRLGSWSDTTGYPSTVTFFEDRLFFAGSTGEPQRVDGSVSSDYENFEPTATDGVVAASNAISVTLNASSVNVVRWMTDGEKGLTIGTSGGEWILRPSTLSEAMSPTNIAAKRSTTYGSDPTLPVRSGNAALFVQRSGRKIRELAYVFELDGFRAPDMTLLAEHITAGGIVEMANTQQPYPVIWAVRGDGVLLGMSYAREEDAVAWHQHAIGGTDAEVESICVIPSADETTDTLWMTVKRTINGGTVRYVELMTPFWESGDTAADAFYVDSGLQGTFGSPVTTISNLHHLEGETVAVLADGATHPNETVTNGSITLDRETTTVTVGLPYNADGKTMRIEAGAADGTAQGKTKRIHQVVWRFFDTLGWQYGRDFDDMFDIPFRSGGDLMDNPPPLYTGDKVTVWPSGYDREGQIVFRHAQPLPATLVALMPQVVTQDR